jgi:hypothetical protein
MANEEHIKILKQGVQTWNRWRNQSTGINPNLWGANLRDLNLTGVDLRVSDLRGAQFINTDLSRADFNLANLAHADFTNANLTNAFLMNAHLEKANLSYSILNQASLMDANLTNAVLNNAEIKAANFEDACLINARVVNSNLERANLKGADLTGALLYKSILAAATMGRTIIGNTDLREVRGLDAVVHQGPSTLGLDTLYKSGGMIPEVFLYGCGVPDEFITYLPSLIGAQQAIQFYSCFISYSQKDEEFAKRLHSRMRDAHLRVWFAPENIRGGEKLYDQIERAIQIHDRLLLVLSEDSMQSEWVKTEIRNARKIEVENKRRKLFPIRLVDFETIGKWNCFDADFGKDLAVEVREYFIPDFSNWNDDDAFEKAFVRLLNDLRTEESNIGRA